MPWLLGHETLVCTCHFILKNLDENGFCIWLRLGWLEASKSLPSFLGSISKPRLPTTIFSSSNLPGCC